MSAPTFQQSRVYVSAAGPSGSLAYTGANTPGNTLLAIVKLTGGTSSPTVSSTLNGTWTQVDLQNVISTSWYGIWKFENCASGTDNVTVNNGGVAGTVEFIIFEYSASTVDQHTSNKSLSGTSVTTGNITTTADNETLIVWLESNSFNNTIDTSGYTLRGTDFFSSSVLWDNTTAAATAGTFHANVTVGTSPGSSQALGILSLKPPLHSISGNAGVASATVSYTGVSSGSVTADGSGNYTIPNLADGAYTVTPGLGGYLFSPTSANETVSGANITGVNFTATPHSTVIQPTLTPGTSTSSGSLLVTMTSSDSGLAGFQIYYTTDGSTPTPSSLQYSVPIAVAASETIKAYAVATGFMDSPVTTAVYTINTTVIQSGLIGYYRILPGESAAALVDYSGSGNTATGTVGTAPTLIAGTGGLQCVGTGAVQLPSALNAALTIQVFVGFRVSIGGTWNNPVQGNGGGAPGNCTGIGVGPFDQVVSGKPSGIMTEGWLNGVGVVSLAMASPTDKIYIDNVLTLVVLGTGSSAGVQNTGVFQIGGTASGEGFDVGNPTYYHGQIYGVLFYNRVLSASEVNQNQIALHADLQARGLTTLTLGHVAADTAPSVLIDGDSISSHLNGLPFTINTNPTVVNCATISETAAQSLLGEAYRGNSFYRDNSGPNIVSCWLGTNDIVNGATPATAYASYVNYCATLRATGFKIAANTMLERYQGGTDYSTPQQAFNLLVRNGWQTFADYLVDQASEPLLGAAGSAGSGSGNVVFPDGIHPSNPANDNLIIPKINRMFSRSLGNNSYTSANTYTTGASAASAITAISTTNYVATITSALHPPVGSVVYQTGITPTDYNGVFQVLTTSPTSYTVSVYTSNPGVGTAFGTTVVPMQLDVDAYIKLGGSAVSPAFTLQTAVGLTGQTVHIKNTSATSTWVVTPFASETINGNSTLAIPPGKAYVLTSNLVSTTAAGSVWTAALESTYYSVPDCRVVKPNSATSESVNGTLTYDVQTSSNPAVPSTDSRTNKPVASGTYPQNSRTPGVFGPGE